MDEERSYPLLQQLEHYNLEFLIPLHFNSDDDDAEGYCHTYSDMDHAVFDPAEEEYYEYNYEFGDDADGPNDSIPEEDDENHDGVRNLDEFCRIFDIDYLDYSDLLSMNIWDLFGITKKQFDLIDWSVIPNAGFYHFYTTFMEEKRNLPVEKKIKYAIADTLTFYTRYCWPIVIPDRPEFKDITYEEKQAYCERIIDSHTFDELNVMIDQLADYWRFYPDALDMNDRREAAGEQTFKYVMCPKPAHIRDLHDKAFRDHMTLETERMAECRREINAQIKATSELRIYQRFLYTDGHYIVKPVESQDALDEEGKILDHCVASYGSYMAKAQSFIYLVRMASEPDKPYFTAEILPPENPRGRYILNQLYTYRDSTDKPESLKRFIVEWSKKTSFAIKCYV